MAILNTRALLRAAGETARDLTHRFEKNFDQFEPYVGKLGCARVPKRQEVSETYPSSPRKRGPRGR